jgi:hypothetical protein
VTSELVAEVYVASAAIDAVTTHVPALDDVNVPALAVQPVAVPSTALYVIAPLPVYPSDASTNGVLNVPDVVVTVMVWAASPRATSVAELCAAL